MDFSIKDILNSYLRELSAKRGLLVISFFVISIGMIFAVLSWPKTFTATSTIYADNSNILAPLMKGTAVTTDIVNQARMAKEILFKREFTDEILESGGWDLNLLTIIEKAGLIESIQDSTEISNIGRNPARLIKIQTTNSDPILAFKVVQKYTSIFIRESVLEMQGESRNAFSFIENQVFSYKSKLQESESRLSSFKSKNNHGTLSSARNRISGHRAEIEQLELELVQLEAQEKLVQSQLAGEVEVSRDLTEINAMRSRINALEFNLDNLRSRFHDNYPDVVQLKSQIQDLKDMLESEQYGGVSLGEDLGQEGVTPLHQELRSRLASLDSIRESKRIQLKGVQALLELETERAIIINASEAELSELTRDYNVTKDFYNNMLGRLENARVSMHLDEEQQGVTFKVQESAIIPTTPDGLKFSQLLLAGLIVAIGAPLGLLVLYMELDPRIKSEASWEDGWPPLLATIPALQTKKSYRVSDKLFVVIMLFIACGLYGSAWAVNAGFINLSLLTEVQSYF